MGENRDCATFFLHVRAGRVWRHRAKPLCSWHREITTLTSEQEICSRLWSQEAESPNDVTVWRGPREGRSWVCGVPVQEGFPSFGFFHPLKWKWKLTVSGGENAGLQGFHLQLSKSMCKYVGVRVSGFWLFGGCWVRPAIRWSGAAGAPCLEGQTGSVSSTRQLWLRTSEMLLANVGLLYHHPCVRVDSFAFFPSYSVGIKYGRIGLLKLGLPAPPSLRRSERALIA